MPQLLIKSGSRATHTIELLPGANRLGRNPANDHCFDDATISSRHCEIIVEGDLVRIQDSGSTNGTFIDGQQIKDAILMPGQTLCLGSIETVLKEALLPIAIPQLPSQAANPFLADGLPACFNHSSSHATMECTQCQKVFCELCVHQVQRVGGAALKLCPVCSGHCRLIGQQTAGKKRKSRISSWLGKVTAKMTGRLTRTNAS